MTLEAHVHAYTDTRIYILGRLVHAHANFSHARSWKMRREREKRRNEKKLYFFYIPISGVDPRSFPRVVVDKVHLPIEVLGDVPSFRKRYLPIPSPWHISLRSKSIQKLFLSFSLSPCNRRAHICARARAPASRAAAHARLASPRGSHRRWERDGETERRERRKGVRKKREREKDPEPRVSRTRWKGKRTTQRRRRNVRTYVLRAHAHTPSATTRSARVYVRRLSLSLSLSLILARYSAIMNTSLS